MEAAHARSGARATASFLQPRNHGAAARAALAQPRRRAAAPPRLSAPVCVAPALARGSARAAPRRGRAAAAAAASDNDGPPHPDGDGEVELVIPDAFQQAMAAALARQAAALEVRRRGAWRLWLTR